MSPRRDGPPEWPIQTFGLAVLSAALPALASARRPVCPKEMARVPGLRACIDRFEASLSGPAGIAISRSRAAPAVRVSQVEVRAACERAGKRLCLRAEWTAACRGAGARHFYPYGARYQPARCHDRALSRRRHTAGPLPTGSLPRCRTPEGIYDLSGNVWEWLADTGPGGNPADLAGGGFGNDDDERHLSCVPEERAAQPVTQRGEAIGFRCCMDHGPQ